MHTPTGAYNTVSSGLSLHPPGSLLKLWKGLNNGGRKCNRDTVRILSLVNKNIQSLVQNLHKELLDKNLRMG